MKQEFNTIEDWIKDTICPIGLVFSTTSVKKALAKSHLTPSELLRPFTISESSVIKKKDSICRIPAYKFDLYDKEKFYAIDKKESNDYIMKLLSNINVRPNWKLSDPMITSINSDFILNKIKNYNYPWCNELEKLIIEFNKFDDYEIYNQPLISIYMCGLNERPKEILQLDESRNYPTLFKSGFYEKPNCKIIIVLNDYSDKSKYITPDKQEKYKNSFISLYKETYYLIFLDINTAVIDENNPNCNFALSSSIKYKYNLLWKKYMHKCDEYNPQIDNSKIINKNEIIYGKYISEKDIKNLKENIHICFTNYVYQKLIDECAMMKINLEKNNFMKYENNNANSSNSYIKNETNDNKGHKLTYYEKKKLILGIYLYYTEDYKEAHKKFKELSKEIKKDDIHHLAAIDELRTICNIHLGKKKKLVKLEKVFYNYISKENYLPALRWFIFIIKSYEICDEIDKIPNVIDKLLKSFINEKKEKSYIINTSENNPNNTSDIISNCTGGNSANISNINTINNNNNGNSNLYINTKNYTFTLLIRCYLPMLYEKKGLYYLIIHKSFRKFLLYSIISTKFYSDISIELYNYSIFNITHMLWFIQDTSNSSFLPIKKYLNKHLADMCKKINYYEGSFYFFRSSLELSKYIKNSINEDDLKNIIIEQEKILNYYLNSIYSLQVKNLSVNYSLHLRKLDLVALERRSFLFIQDEDYLINESLMKSKVKKKEFIPWKYFKIYEEPDQKQRYCHLDQCDIDSIDEMDALMLKKMTYSNYNKKKYFKGNIGDPLYVIFNIHNPLMIDLDISSIKLLCDFLPMQHEGNSGELNIPNNNNVVNSVNNNNNKGGSLLSMPSNNSNDNSCCTLNNSNNNNISVDNNKNNNLILDESNEKSIDISDNMEFQKISLKLKAYSTRKIQIYVKGLQSGQIIIKGVEMIINEYAKIESLFRENNEPRLYGYFKKRKKSIESTNIVLYDSESIIENAKNLSFFSDWIYDIINIENDISLEFPIGKFVTCYNYELFNFPLILKNNSSKYRVKKFTIFINEVSKTEKENKRLKFNLNDYITIYKRLNKDNNTEKVLIPFIPSKTGVFYFKCMVKFEEEYKFKYIEVKRFIIELKVKNSIRYDITEQIENFDEIEYKNKTKQINNIIAKTTIFKLKSQISIINNDELEKLNINNIYYNKLIRCISKEETDNKYLNSDDKYYSEYMLEIAKINNTNTNNNSNSQNNLNTQNSSLNISINNSFIFNSFLSSNLLGTSNDDSSQLKYYEQMLSKLPIFDEYILHEQTHIMKSVCQLISKNKTIIYPWSLCDKKRDNKIINGLLFYNVELKQPEINSTFLRKIVNNSIKINVTQNKLDDINTLVNLSISLNKQSLLEMVEIVWYEIFISDIDDLSFVWIGPKRYKIINRTKNDNNLIINKNDNIVQNLIFSCISQHNQIIDLNKIGIKLYFIDEKYLSSLNDIYYSIQINNIAETSYIKVD